MRGTPTSTDGSGRLEVEISNERSDPESVTVRVLDSGGSVVDEAEYGVDPGVSRSHAFEGPSDGRYRAMVIGGGWRTNADWDAAACRDFLARTRLSGDEMEPETALSVEKGKRRTTDRWDVEESDRSAGARDR